MSAAVYLDTNAIIDFIEQRHPGLALLFAYTDRGAVELFTSELTLAEVLVRPLQRKEDWLLQIYEGLLVADQIVKMIPIGIGILRQSAAIRATLGGKTPDSIHVATAVASGCNYLVSSDKRLRVPVGIERIGAGEIDIEALENWR